MAGLVVGIVEILLAVQAAQATVVGTVRDGETGEPLAGALVVLTDLDRAVATDADGRYVLGGVPPGPQHLAFRFIGYSARTLHALVPREGVLEINASLRPEPIPLEALEVRPLVSVRGVESGDDTAFPDRGLTIAAVRNHPLLAEPDVFQALGGGEVYLSPESPSGIHVRGGASDQTAYVLDGIPVFSPYHAAGVFSAFNPDALSRLELSSSAPSPALPDALSGAVDAATRAPGSRAEAQVGVSTTQARLTLDGPVGRTGAGYLLSARSGVPGALIPPDDPSYLKGETSDLLGKIEGAALGGHVRILGYDSENEIDAAAEADSGDAPSPAPPRNVFTWHSRSVGAEWSRIFSGGVLRVRVFRAAGDADALWAADSAGPVAMASTRRDEGVWAGFERRTPGATTLGGIRYERSRTTYRLESDSAGPSFRVSARTPVAAAFLRHARRMPARTELELGASLAAAAGDVRAAPRAQLRWAPSARIGASVSYARLLQFAQSLRNHESVVGNIFPVDLYVGAAAPGVPVARSDQGVVAAEVRPLNGMRLGVQAYTRALDGLLLVAPRDGEPFTTGGFTTGSGTSRGISLEAAVSSARYGIVASYGWQRVRLAYGDSSYVPQHGTSHRVDAGVIVFPSVTSSIRLGLVAASGRRTTTASGALEWEACNLIDRGCEFGGSPRYGSEPLGATALPAYLRVDLAVRKHWHVELAGRDASLGFFGTLTNVFGRANVLTYARDPLSGEPLEIQMLPRAPLVVGLDGRF